MWADGPCHDDRIQSRNGSRPCTVLGFSHFRCVPFHFPSWSFGFSLFFFTSYLCTPFLFRFSVFAYGHLPGVPAGPAVMLQIPCNPDPHFSNHSLFPYRRVSYSCP